MLAIVAPHDRSDAAVAAIVLQTQMLAGGISCRRFAYSDRRRSREVSHASSLRPIADVRCGDAHYLRGLEHLVLFDPSPGFLRSTLFDFPDNRITVVSPPESFDLSPANRFAPLSFVDASLEWPGLSRPARTSLAPPGTVLIVASGPDCDDPSLVRGLLDTFSARMDLTRVGLLTTKSMDSYERRRVRTLRDAGRIVHYDRPPLDDVPGIFSRYRVVAFASKSTYSALPATALGAGARVVAPRAQCLLGLVIAGATGKLLHSHGSAKPARSVEQYAKAVRTELDAVYPDSVRVNLLRNSRNNFFEAWTRQTVLAVRRFE